MHKYTPANVTEDLFLCDVQISLVSMIIHVGTFTKREGGREGGSEGVRQGEIW